MSLGKIIRFSNLELPKAELNLQALTSPAGRLTAVLPFQIAK